MAASWHPYPSLIGLTVAARWQSQRRPPHRSDPQPRRLQWRVADLLRGDYKQSEYGRVILDAVIQGSC